MPSCSPTRRRARLFDSNTGAMLTRQVVIVFGERITDVGSESQVKIPAGAQLIDLSQDGTARPD